MLSDNVYTCNFKINCGTDQVRLLFKVRHVTMVICLFQQFSLVDILLKLCMFYWGESEYMKFMSVCLFVNS